MPIDFPPGTRVRTSVDAIRRTNLHAHPNAVEIVYVLRGAAHVRVSSESFDLEAGDYAVLNRRDPHVIVGSADNVTAVLHLDLAAFGDVDPFADDIMFACESFDLARYRRQEALLRGLLLDIVGTESDGAAEELVRLLCDGYSLADYYQRDKALTGAARERFLSIMAYVRTHLDSRDLLDEVARSHHYSKSYVSHFVKDAAAISFSNAVTATRVMQAEPLLLTTELTMRDISAQCGFSDVKYFTRCFVDWFKQTPAEYRAANKPETQRDNDVEPVSADVIRDLVHEHRRRVASPDDSPRLSLTPILLKNIGSRADLFDKIRKFQADDAQHASALAGAAPVQPRRRHLLPMRIGPTEVSGHHLVQGIGSFATINATPCLVLEFSDRQGTLELISALAGQLRELPDVDVAIWLTYSALHAQSVVDDVIDVARDEHGLTVQAILMT